MSQATMNLHHNVKKPGSIIFSALIAFIAGAIFPVGLILVLILTFIDQNIFSLPEIVENNFPLGLLVIGLFAALYSVLHDISENFEIYKKVLIEQIGTTEAIKNHLANK